LSKLGRCFAHDFIYQIKRKKFSYDRKKEAIYMYINMRRFLRRHASVIDDRVSRKKNEKEEKIRMNE